jgi:Glycosyl hydrolases family 2, TIM barrel domain
MKRLPPVLLSLVISGTAPAAPVPVRLDAEGMLRGGERYFVKGAGGDEKLKELAARGANSIRTWATTDLDKIMDTASQNGLTVSAGIWLESECSWFSYQNPGHCAKQTARVKAEILRYREHPALLAWGLGNEAEGDGTNAAYWQQLNRLAQLVHELDPVHPTFTAVAGIAPAKAAGLNEHAPHLDFLGVNTYAALPHLRKILTDVKWTRPWLVTEWGPRGFWESPRGAGGMAIEQTSTEKAAMMARCYDATIAPGGNCLGSYAFVWGAKNEATITWFGLLTHSGETTAAIDVLEQRWSGRLPANRAPEIERISGLPAKPVAPGSLINAAAEARDAEGDPLTWRWSILPEFTKHDNAVSPPIPTAIPDTLPPTPGPANEGRAPTKPGRYRVHVEVSDGKGHAATANAPLVVE